MEDKLRLLIERWQQIHSSLQEIEQQDDIVLDKFMLSPTNETKIGLIPERQRLYNLYEDNLKKLEEVTLHIEEYARITPAINNVPELEINENQRNS